MMANALIGDVCTLLMLFLTRNVRKVDCSSSELTPLKEVSTSLWKLLQPVGTARHVCIRCHSLHDNE